MTTTDSRDVIALRAVIDGGDYAVLPILADALEEAGDPRAAGLRAALARFPDRRPDQFLGLGRPRDCYARWYRPTRNAEPVLTWFPHQCLPDEVYDRLPEGVWGDEVIKEYESPSAAFLALAAAM